jgi:hemoglobin
MNEDLYTRLGGQAAVNAAVEIFYRKVIRDPRIKMFFSGVDINQQIEKQKGFLTFAFGGASHYSGNDLRTAHAPLVQRGLNSGHFDIVVQHLRSTLEELGIEESLVNEALKIIGRTRHEVLGR